MGAVGLELRICPVAASLCSTGLGHGGLLQII
jgi:hypothetical protein